MRGFPARPREETPGRRPLRADIGSAPSFYVQESDGTVQRVRGSALERVTKLERFCADLRVLAAADGKCR